MKQNKINYRNRVASSDPGKVEEIVRSTGFFSEEEISIARELVDEYLKHGSRSGYNFIFAEIGDTMIGYVCFGAIPATKFSYDLYWIAVHADWRGKGAGKLLIEECEKKISELGGRQIYAETSGREEYGSTRKFYLTCGYTEEARLKDFYGPADSKHFFVKRLD